MLKWTKPQERDLTTMATERIAVVGAGIVGLAVARRLSAIRHGAEITVIDKETSIGAHQTSHNSGVVHSGIYYPPDSLKANLCIKGSRLLHEYCVEREIPFVRCGKLVIAANLAEVAALDRLYSRALNSQVAGLRRVAAGEIGEIEPCAVGVAALYSASTSITDFSAVAQGFADDVLAAGGHIKLGEAVVAITGKPNGVAVRVGEEEQCYDRVVLCAGLQSDTLAIAAGDEVDPAIVPFRGEYFRLVSSKKKLVRGLIYPVPDPNYPFLGVHFTRRVNGEVDIGPNAVLALAREGYLRRDISPRDLWEILRLPGFRQLARKHWKMGLYEMIGSASKHQFLNRARLYLPELKDVDVLRAGSGVRAQAVDARGSLIEDFRIHILGRVLAVRNAPSPAATASLAIAEYICDEFFNGNY